MADVRPFRGLRYDPQVVPDLSQVLCPPYDVITPELEQELSRRSPYNMVRLEYHGSRPVETQSGSSYTAAAHLLQEWRSRGVLMADHEPSLYLLQERYADEQGDPRTRHALFGRVRLEEFSRGVVLPHEETATAAKRDRLELLQACQANLSPIMGLYRDPSGQVAHVLHRAQQEAPLASGVHADGEELTLWRISHGDGIATIGHALAAQPIYLADGHHRYETALHYRNLRRGQGLQEEESSYVMMALVDITDPGLHVMGYHRLLSEMNREGESRLARSIEGAFEVTADVQAPGDPLEAARHALALLGERPAQPPAVALLDSQGRRLRVLTLRGQAQARLASQSSGIPDLAACDVWTLQEGVLKPLLASLPPSAARLEFTHDAGQALHRLQEGAAQAAFLLRPLPLDVFERVTRQGVRLPPKSTYFSPKLPTGLVIYVFEA